MSTEGRPSCAQSVATLYAALEAGATLIDTADSYHIGADEVGHNELLIQRALAQSSFARSELVIATKGGHIRPGDGTWRIDGSPDYIAAAARASLSRLKVDAIDLYYLHRPDPKVPLAESVGALVTLHDEGLIKAAGVSNVNDEEIRLAHSILGDRLIAVQNKLSLVHQGTTSGVALCNSLGLSFVARSPLGSKSGVLSLDRIPGVRQIARSHCVSTQRVALAWALAAGSNVIPVFGTTQPSTVFDSMAATDLILDADEVELLTAQK